VKEEGRQEEHISRPDMGRGTANGESSLLTELLEEGKFKGSGERGVSRTVEL